MFSPCYYQCLIRLETAKKNLEENNSSKRTMVSTKHSVSSSSQNSTNSQNSTDSQTSTNS